MITLVFLVIIFISIGAHGRSYEVSTNVCYVGTLTLPLSILLPSAIAVVIVIITVAIVIVFAIIFIVVLVIYVDFYAILIITIRRWSQRIWMGKEDAKAINFNRTELISGRSMRWNLPRVFMKLAKYKSNSRTETFM